MTLKPGTRCECQDKVCTGNAGHGDVLSRCFQPATRVVVVEEQSSTYRNIRNKRHVPMCPECAAFHESKVTK